MDRSALGSTGQVAFPIDSSKVEPCAQRQTAPFHCFMSHGKSCGGLQIGDFMRQLLLPLEEWPVLSRALAPVLHHCWCLLARIAPDAPAAFEVALDTLVTTAKDLAATSNGETEPSARFADVACDSTLPAAAVIVAALMAVTACGGSCSSRAAKLADAVLKAMQRLSCGQRTLRMLMSHYSGACAGAEQCSCQRELLAALLSNNMQAGSSAWQLIEAKNTFVATSGISTEVADAHVACAIVDRLAFTGSMHGSVEWGRDGAAGPVFGSKSLPGCPRGVAVQCLPHQSDRSVQLRLTTHARVARLYITQASSFGWQAALNAAALAVPAEDAPRPVVLEGAQASHPACVRVAAERSGPLSSSVSAQASNVLARFNQVDMLLFMLVWK